MPFHCQYDMAFFYCRVTLKALIIPERMLAADVTFSLTFSQIRPSTHITKLEEKKKS